MPDPNTPLGKYELSKPKREMPWQMLTGVALGTGVGIVLAAPVLGWTLPDSNATLIGSAIGAAAAVFGAFWLQRHEAQARRRAVASAMVAIVSDLNVVVRDWNKRLKADKAEQSDYSTETFAVRQLAETADQLSGQLFPAISELDYRSVRVLVDLQLFARTFLFDTETTAALYKQGNRVKKSPADWLKLVHPLHEAVRHAHDHFAFVSAER